MINFSYERKKEKQDRHKFNRDTLVKTQISKRPNLQKKQSLFRKLSNSSFELNLNQNNKFKKIYENKKESQNSNKVGFPKFSEEIEYKNYLQQTL